MMTYSTGEPNALLGVVRMGPDAAWLLARIDEAARTEQPWMMDPLAVRRAWEGRDAH